MLKNLSRIENKEIDYLELFTSLEHLNGEYEIWVWKIWRCVLNFIIELLKMI